MRIRNLDTFYWIASLGSFRAAANKLNLSQPAVSARIQVLERDLGVKVFERELKKSELTSEGRLLFVFAERQMKLEQDVLSAFVDTTTIEHTIRLGASETIVSSWLPDFMVNLSRMRRNFSFDLRVDSTDNLRNALVGREVDLAFLMGPVAEVSIANHELCAYEMIFAATPDLAALHDGWDLERIACHQVLTFATNTKPYLQIREMLSAHSDGMPNMTTSTSLGAIIRLAISGMGICAVPKAIIRDELRTGSLVALRTGVELVPITFTASHISASPTDGLVAEIIKQSIQFLEGRLIKNIYQS